MAQSLNQSLNLGAVSPAKRLMIALTGGAGLILLGGSSALVGLNSHLTALQTTAQQKQKEVDGSEGIAKRYVATQAAYTEIQGRLQCLETSVSPKAYVPTLLGQLQGLAATTHLHVLSVRPSAPPPVATAAPIVHPAAVAAGTAPGPVAPAPPPPPPYDTLDIAVDVSGTYADTATFLYSLTRFPKIISVTSVQMHPDAQADKTPGALPGVATSLKLTAFMFHGGGTDTAPVAGAALAGIVPAVTAGTVSGAAGRAATGAVGATKAANARGAVGVGTL